MRFLFDRTKVSRQTIPQLYSCQDGNFTFQDSAVFSIIIIFHADPDLEIKIENKNNPTQPAIIKDIEVASILIIPGNCILRFKGKMTIIITTYQREIPIVKQTDKDQKGTAHP
jgi:hypothetical protein